MAASNGRLPICPSLTLTELMIRSRRGTRRHTAAAGGGRTRPAGPPAPRCDPRDGVLADRRAVDLARDPATGEVVAIATGTPNQAGAWRRCRDSRRGRSHLDWERSCCAE